MSHNLNYEAYTITFIVLIVVVLSAIVWNCSWRSPDLRDPGDELSSALHNFRSVPGSPYRVDSDTAPPRGAYSQQFS